MHPRQGDHIAHASTFPTQWSMRGSVVFLMCALSDNQTYCVRLNTKNRRAAPEHAQAVLSILCIEHFPAGERHDPNLLALLLENTGGGNGNRDLTPGAHDRQILTLATLMYDISALGSPFNGRALQLREVLPGERED